MYKANIGFASMRLWSASSSKVSKKTRLPKLHHQYASGQGIEMRPTSDQTTTHVASFLHLEVAHLLFEDMIRDGHVLFLHQFDSICPYHLRNVRCGWPFQYPWLHLQPQPTQAVMSHDLSGCKHDLGRKGILKVYNFKLPWFGFPKSKRLMTHQIFTTCTKI